MARIYTRGGDDGRTGLLDGSRVPKCDDRVSATGDVDELNAVIGMARAELAPLKDAGRQIQDLDDALGQIQRDLFALGALLADPGRDGEPPALNGPADRLSLGQARIDELEVLIDSWEAQLDPLRVFVLPGGSRAAAVLQLARSVARRAERGVVPLVCGGVGNRVAIVYLNRLSDLLFVAARLANRRCEIRDILWT